MTPAARRALAVTVTAITWACGLIVCALAWFRYIDTDEIEHLHSAWHVSIGHVPYVDFFEHHHALLWYCLAPVLALLNQSAQTVVTMRMLWIPVTAAIARATYLLALEAGATRDTARLAVMLLLSMTTFVYVAIEIRPGVPQTLFMVVSALYLVRMFRSHTPRHAVYSGIAAAISFLFLQKAVLFLALLPFVFVWALRREHLIWRLGGWWLGGFVVTCAPWAVYLAATVGLWPYVQVNWLLNLYVPATHNAVSVLSPFFLRDIARNAAFWLAVAGMAVTLARRRLPVGYAVPGVIGLWLLFIVSATNRGVDRYLVAAIPFLAVAVAGWLAELGDRFQPRPRAVVAVLLAMSILPMLAMARTIGLTNTAQLERIQYVLDHTTTEDRVVDFSRSINLFRPDGHYFWMMPSEGLRFSTGIAGGRYARYVTCDMIRSVRPKVISQRHHRIESCGLSDQYVATPYDGLFFRAETPNGQ
jgi:hypothetical protein